MVAELAGFPGVTVTEAATGRPLPEEVIVADAKARGLLITDDLLALYRFANWARLEWNAGEDWKYGGKIGIPSLEMAATPTFWRSFGAPKDALKRSFHAYGVETDLAFDKVTPIDFFARGEDNIELAGMFVNQGRLDVFASSGDLSCMTDSHLVTLGEYVDLIIRAYGAPSARAALNGGASEQPRANEAISGILTKRYELREIVELATSEPDVGVINSFFR